MDELELESARRSALWWRKKLGMPLPKEEKPKEEWVRRLESMRRSASQGFWILVGWTLFCWVVTNAIAKG